MTPSFFFALLLTTTLLAPQPPRPADPAAPPYDFEHPSMTYRMPHKLRELSGIALVGKNQMACIEDQTGEIYLYDLAGQRIVNVIAFDGKGDYEDVAVVKNSYLVLRSDGTLFKRTGSRTTSYATGLTQANNTEGLTYDAATGTLLVACKGDAEIGQPDQKRAIYRLNPATYHIESQPAYVLDVAQLIALDQRGGKQQSITKFAPSAVAIQPQSHHLFVLAASGNALAELDAKGTPVAVHKLPRKLFPQPEGLAFAPNGDLYIASEAGDTDQALIQLFRHVPSN